MSNTRDEWFRFPIERSGRMTVNPVLILAYGNLSRGDDALAPLLLDRIRFLPAALVENIDCLADFQLQIEHALDLKARTLVLFVDASVAKQQPVRLTRLQAAREYGYTTHAMSPQAVIGVFRQIERIDPPPCFLLSVQGESFKLGEGLSKVASRNLNQAAELVTDLLETPALAYWQGRCNA